MRVKLPLFMMAYCGAIAPSHAQVVSDPAATGPEIAAESAQSQTTPQAIKLTPAQLFSVADQARDAGDFPSAEAAYRALTSHPDLELRTEARFRLGQMLASQKKFAEAAVLYRAILDEKPNAQGVRLELAAVLAYMGKEASARREIRQVKATGGLPIEVAQLVDQFSTSLRALRPYGASFELALAPSTNINRATSATTLDTVIAPFELSDDARAQSGVGLKLGGQVYGRVALNPALKLIARGSAQSSLYRAKQFNDVVFAAEAGLDTNVGKVRLQPKAGRSWRYFGNKLYATTNTLSVNGTKALGKSGQLEIDGSLGFTSYRLNKLQDGKIMAFSAGYERALSARAGGGLTINVQRQTARDPGYANWSGGVTLLAWREIYGSTVFVTAQGSRLVSDARLALFPKKREDWLGRANLGINVRKIQIAGFSPVVRLSYEYNASTVGLYDFKRVGAEIGITRAF
jgi:hypothetical protein